MFANVSRLAAALALAGFASGCVSEGSAPGLSAAGLPSSATYRCEDGNRIEIENRGSSVVLTRADAEPRLLPAAPAESRSRYGADGIALVVEGDEALLMQSGEEPHTCRR